MDVVELELATRQEADGVMVVCVGGEIDHDTAPQLDRAARAALGDGTRRLVVDLTTTEFMDSSGLGTLVGLSKSVDPGALVVVCPQPSLRKLFAISRLDEVLAVYPDLGSALGS